LLVDSARKLFKLSKDAASLLVWVFKKLESFGFWVFVGDVISGIGFDIFGPGYLTLGANC